MYRWNVDEVSWERNIGEWLWETVCFELLGQENETRIPYCEHNITGGDRQYSGL
jgi:hypothetical protein